MNIEFTGIHGCKPAMKYSNMEVLMDSSNTGMRFLSRLLFLFFLLFTLAAHAITVKTSIVRISEGTKTGEDTLIMMRETQIY
jgi:hypothetical protein